MKHSRVLVFAAALVLAACGGGGDAEGTAGQTINEGGQYNDTAGTPGTTTGTSTGASTGQPVDTAGMGVNPPTAGGQLVDTAGRPGPTDTVTGTLSAP